MFSKILVANRGEIACRAMRTAKKMGIATVAVYSDADGAALHTRTADEAVHIGAAASAESYLSIDKIIQACKDTGADAVYPGYGFLSENSAFAEALEANNIAFIGPGKHAIECMGDKITSKKLAIEAGVNTVPGHTDIITDSDHAIKIATSIGYPVMLKASAGGGGKGMRVAYNDDECREGFERATNEAKSSFGDDRIFIEKFIEKPRHIEIQVLADKHGNTIYLNERECSIQRRHQKVIEEAPSPFLDEETRKAMGEQSCALAKAVDYHSAGTVEFIVDANRNFYFLEMNTRLQVEHPVTEMITGLDLIEEMIHIAAGEKLKHQQTDIGINGWSMEARVYAENPFREFLPSTGRVTRYVEPVMADDQSASPQPPHVRVDSGVFEGGEVSIFYDPMISKLITWGESRDIAIDRMHNALDQYQIDGVTTNIPFLSALFSDSSFRAGDFSTHFIEQHYPEGFSRRDATADEKHHQHVAAAVTRFLLRQRAAAISGTMNPALPVVTLPLVVIDNGEQYPFKITQIDETTFELKTDSKTTTVRTDWKPSGAVFKARIDDKDVILQWRRTFVGYEISNSKHVTELQVMSPRAASKFQLMPIRKPVDTSSLLLSPMPGLLIDVMVKEGDTVNAGDSLAIVEAMKMENVLKAERSGKIAAIVATVGSTLDVDQKILEFETT